MGLDLGDHDGSILFVHPALVEYQFRAAVKVDVGVHQYEGEHERDILQGDSVVEQLDEHGDPGE